MQIINLGVIKASPRKLQAVWSLMTLEELLKSEKWTGEDYLDKVQSLIDKKLNITTYIKESGGPRFTYGDEGEGYRPFYCTNVKITAWFLELYGECND